MRICFPKHTLEGKLLIETVGLVEATRDWMENNYEVRTPEQVLAKLNNRGISMPYQHNIEPTIEKLENIGRITTKNESFIKKSIELQKEYDKRVREALLKFIKKFNIEVVEEGDSILDNLNYKTGKPMAAFDLLQKYLVLRKDITLREFALQNANIIYSFLGKKSKLSVELWKNIESWDKYDIIYDRYVDAFNEPELNNGYWENINRPNFNAFAHRQAIIHMIAEALEVGIDNEYIGPKHKNPDLNVNYYKNLGNLNQYSGGFVNFYFAKIWNWVNKTFFNKPIRLDMTQDDLIETVLDIVDDVYKEEYGKFFRSYQEVKPGVFKNLEGVDYEQKFYQETLDKDPFVKGVIDSLFQNPFIDYLLSGSQTLRKYGRVLRAISEDLHDIDGVITLEQFLSESNNKEFRKWVETRGLQLKKQSRIDPRAKDKFIKEIIPFLEEQSWYKNLKIMYPSWTLENAFIGRDHKAGESITITGYIEHPTETEIVKGDANWKAPWRKDAGQLRPKRIILDFFLRTKEGNYPEVFDNYWKDWKQIFEAKINMGRDKDIADLIYFEPFVKDIYKFTNKGFRYFTFPSDITAAELARIEQGDNSFMKRVNYKKSTGYAKLDDVPSYYTDLQDLLESPAALNGMLNQLPFQLNPTESQKAVANEFIKKFVQGLSDRTGINFSFISPEDAAVITAGTKNPWNGQPAFAFGGTVYFVGDNINTTIAFHEFSHPIVDVLYLSNPELFKSLYNELKSTNEGQRLITMLLLDESYGTDDNDIMFQKEALVRAISERANAIYTNQKNSEGFMGWIKNIMFHIKQLLRKTFGKIKIEKLSPNTTIDQMAEMLANDNFKIETLLVTEKGAVEYYKYLDENLLKDLYDAGDKLSEVLYNYSETIEYPLRNAIENEDWEYVLDLMKDDLDIEDQNQIKAIRRDLSKYVEDIKKYGKNKLNEIQDLNGKATALATSLGRLDYVLNNFETDMIRMSSRSKELLRKNTLTKEEAKELKTMMARAHYINKVAQYWSNFYSKDNGIRLFTDNHPSESPWRKIADQTSSRISRIKLLYKPIIVAGNKSWITAILEPMQQHIDNRYTQQIDKLQKAGDIRNAQILKEEYEKQRITPQRIEDMLKGEWEDANPFNIFLESYMYSADDIVGGFTVWFANHLTDIENNTIRRYNNFLEEVMPLIKELGYDPNNISQIINWVAREDLDGYTDDNGNWIETKVWRFRSKHKNFYRDEKNFNHRIEQAHKKGIETNDFTEHEALINERDEWKAKYFYREYKDEVYEVDKIFEETYTDEQGNVIPIGQMTKEKRDSIFERLNFLENQYVDEEERVKKVTEREALWKEYNQLCSFKNTKDQDKKPGSIEYRMAEVMQKYKEASKSIYEWKLKLGKFQDQYEKYADLMASKTTSKEEFDAAMQEWWDNNTVVAATPEYYKTTSKILKQVIAIYQEASGKSEQAMEMSKLHKELNDILYNYRDDDGQTNGRDIGTPTRNKIKAISERIIQLREEMNSSLTAEERDRFEYYEDLFQTGRYNQFTEQEKKDFDELTAKIQAPSRDGLTAAQRVNLSILYRQLNVYRSKQATSYYLEIVNAFFMDSELLKKFPQITMFDKKKGKEGVINNLTAEFMLNAWLSDDQNATVFKDGKPVLLIEAIIEESPEFKSWFLKNHIKVKKWDSTTRRKQDSWQRLPQWSVVRPNSSNNLVHTTVRDRNGNLISLPGKPALRYYSRQVKGLTGREQRELIKLKEKQRLGTANAEELATIFNYEKIESEGYKTRKVVGDTIDNRGRWLPKSIEEGASDNQYIDQEYLDMANGSARDQKIYNLTEAFKRHHLAGQTGVDKYGQLYLDVPRFRKNSYERFRSTNPIPRYWEGVKSLFLKRPDDADSGYNPDLVKPEDSVILAGADIWGSEQNKRFPMQGIYQIPVDEVSTDIMHSMARYMHSAERVKKLREINPMAETLQDTLKHPDNRIKNMKHANKLMYKVMHALKWTDKEGTYHRSAAIDNLIEREFYGKNQKGFVAENVFINKVVNMMFRGASMSYLAIQLPSAVTNALAQMTQNIIEGFGGEYFTLKDLGVGSVDAGKTMMQISMEIYKQGVNSYDVQLVNLFDAVPGRVFDNDSKIGTASSRTVLADTVSLSWMYSPRKFMETYATLQAFYGIMNHVEIEQTVNGQKQIIKYKDAFEIKDNQIALKPGIDPTYGPEGAKYKQLKNQIRMIQYAMNGAYDKFGQPEAQRYLAFRMFSFLRRYFTTMLTNRWGITRHNPGLMDTKTGFYIEAWKAFVRGISSKGKYFQNMAPSEKAAFKKVFAEIAIVLLADFIISAFFGWDPDDDDKYEKLRAKSGDMPLPGVAEGEYPFEWGGWFSNHALFQLMQVEAQTQMWMPLPGWGLKDYTGMASIEPASIGPTIDLYSKIFDDVINYTNDNERAYYQRSVGPYMWQQKDELKLWNHIGSIYGLRGQFVSPVTAISKKEQARARR